MREQAVVTASPKPSSWPLRIAVIAVLLHASAGGAIAEEPRQEVALPTGDVWVSQEPLIEYRPLPTIECLPLMSNSSIGDVWLYSESAQPSCVHEQAEGSAASYDRANC
jgi:hypothetical protein